MILTLPTFSLVSAGLVVEENLELGGQDIQNKEELLVLSQVGLLQMLCLTKTNLPERGGHLVFR